VNRKTYVGQAGAPEQRRAERQCFKVIFCYPVLRSQRLMTPLIAPLLATLLRGTGHCVRYGRLAPCSVLRLHRRIRVESGCGIDRSDPVHCPVRQIECGTPAETDGSRIPPVNGSCSGGKPALCTRSPEGGAARFNRNLWGSR